MSYTTREFIEKFGNDSEKKRYKNKQDIKNIKSTLNRVKSEYYDVERKKIEKTVYYEVGEKRKFVYPQLSKKIFGNNKKDDLTELLLEYILMFSESIEFEKNEYYNLTFLESRLDIFSNFTRIFSSFKTKNMIDKRDFEQFIRVFKMELSKENVHLYRFLNSKLREQLADVRQIILSLLTTKTCLYDYTEHMVAVISEEKRFKKKSPSEEERELDFEIRGEYQNLEENFKSTYNQMINNINDVLENDIKKKTCYNSKSKSYSSLYFQDENNKINVEISIKKYNDIQNLLKEYRDSLELKKFQLRYRSGKLSLENKRASMLSYENKINEEYYKGYITKNNRNVSLYFKFKNDIYRLRNLKNTTFYQIDFFVPYYLFQKKCISKDYLEYVRDILELIEDKNNYEEKMKKLRNSIRELVAIRFELAVYKELENNDYYIEQGLFYEDIKIIIHNICSKIIWDDK